MWAYNVKFSIRSITTILLEFYAFKWCQGSVGTPSYTCRCQCHQFFCRSGMSQIPAVSHRQNDLKSAFLALVRSAIGSFSFPLTLLVRIKKSCITQSCIYVLSAFVAGSTKLWPCRRLEWLLDIIIIDATNLQVPRNVCLPLLNHI